MTRKPHVTYSRPRRLFSFSFAALLMAGLLAVLPTVTKTAPAQAAEGDFTCLDTLYASQDSTVYSLNPATGAMTAVTGGAYSEPINALAVTPKGDAAYVMGSSNGSGIAKVFKVGTAAHVKSVSGLRANAVVVAGAVNPVTGGYWIGQTTSDGRSVNIYRVDLAAVGSTVAVTPQATIPTGVTATISTDMAFDSKGNLYVVSSTSGASGQNKLYRLTAAALAAGGAQTPTAITPLAEGGFPGIAFGSDGYIYVQGGSQLHKLKPTNGQTAATVNTRSGSTPMSNGDLGSCATPGVMDNVVKDITARKKAGDQFTVSLSGPDLTTLTGTTAGTDVGLQTGATEIAGPSLVLPGTEYTFTESRGNTTTVMGDYSSTYECTTETGTVVTTGTGTTGKLTVPPADRFGVNANITCVFTNTPITTGLTLTKSASGTPAQAGDPITYTYTVSNTGNVPLTGLSIADPQQSGKTITCAATTLAAGASTTCTVSSTYAVTQADVNAGTAGGTATATAAYGSTNVTATASSATPITRTARLKLEKTASGTPTKAGDTITYSFTVTNTGNTTVTTIRVNDPLLGGTVASCATATLAPGASATCTAPYTVTQGDVNAGTVNNTASVSGTPPTGTALTTDSTSTRSTATPLTRNPQLTLVKSATGTPTKAGDTITYSFRVTNSGNTTVTDVAVSDPRLGSNAVTCPTTTLAPGASVTCTAADYTVTQGDVDAGTVANSATATGNGPGGVAVPSSTSSGSSTATPIVATGSLTVTLTQSTATVTAAGQKITYTHVVRNTGDATLSNVAVTDARGTTITSTDSGALAPGATRTFTSEYTVTQADVDAGRVVNTSTGTARTPANAAVTGSSAQVEKTITASAALRASLAATGAPQKAGDPVTYTTTVENTGNVTVTGLAGTDDLDKTYVCAVTTLAPGATTTCTVSYVVTQADVDAGGVRNEAAVSPAPPTGARIEAATNQVVTPIHADTWITATVVTSGTPTKAGDTITYTATVKNEGDVTIRDVAVTDTLGRTYTCDVTRVAPQGVAVCVATYRVTQADVDAGEVANHPQATATAVTGTGMVAGPSDPIVTPIAPAPELTTTLTQSAAAVAKAGDQVTYTYTVRNTGNVTATDVKVTDTRGLTPTCAPTTLAPGASATCSATYTVTQAQVEAGTVTNTATGTAKAPSGASFGDDSDEVTKTIAAASAVSIVLSQSSAAVTKAGDGVLYTYTVTNTGNLDLRDLLLTDSREVASACVSTLAVGETVVCSATHTVTQAEVDAGVVANLASVAARAARGPAATATSARVDKTIVRSATMTTTLAAAGTPTKAGDTITHTATVENTGNTTISGIAVVDTLGGTYVCDVTSLAPGAEATCTSTHRVTQAQVNAGTVVDTATGSGTAPTGAVSDPSDPVTTSIPRSPELTSTLLDAGTPTKAGDTITYRLTVENTGNVSLGTIAVTDDLGTTYACVATSLHPAERTTCTATYSVTQADVDRGTVENTAEVTGAGAPGVTATDTSNDVDTTIPADAKLTTALVPSGTPTKKGDEITWTATVRNTGNVTVDTVAVSDTLGNTYACAPRTLAPNAVATCVATDAVTQSEVNAGEVVTTATGTAKTPSGGGVSADSAERTVTIAPGPALTVVLSQSATAITKAGQTIDYTYVVENTGNVTLGGLGTSDRLSQPQSCDAAALLPGDTANCTTSYTVTQADVDRGEVVQLVSAFTRAPDGTAVEGDSNQVRTTITAAPSVETTVESSGTPTKKGDEITYTVTVENTGNVTIDDVTATDTLGNTYVCVPTTLLPGEKATCTATHEVTQGDVDRGSVENTVTGGGESPSGTRTTDPAPKVMTTIPADPELTTTVVTAGTPEKAGDTIDLTVTVGNTGNVTITQPTVTDTLGHTYVCDATRVLPGDTVTCTATHTVTQADVDRGEVATVVTGAGQDPSRDPVEDDAPRTVVTIGAAPRLTITDASVGALVDADQDGRDSAGDTVTYTYVVRNAGNVTLTDPTVTDTLGTVVDCVPVTLAPGGSATCVSAPVPVTQRQVDAGEARTHSVAVATPPSGPEVTSADSDELVTPLRPSEALAIVTRIESWKDANGDGLLNRGDLVLYAFDVTNTGNLTVDDLGVRDRRLASQKIAIDVPAPVSPLGVPVTSLAAGGPTLAPGQTATARGVAGYVVSGDDVQVRVIDNDATADAVVRRTGDAIDARSNVVTSVPTASPRLSITTDAKVADVNRNGVTDQGDTIRYTYTVTNTGDITLENLRVADARLTDRGITITCTPRTLAPGASATCTTSAPYVITAEDVRNGSVVDAAMAYGQDPVSSTVTDVASEQSDSIVETEALEQESPAKRRELPDAGGPAVALGALGVVALGAGVSLVGAARRRRDEAA